MIDEEDKSVKRTIKVISLKDRQSDYQYWLKQSIEERLMALEMLRQQYITWKYGSQQRFQRVYRIIELSQS